jgi:uncharacterized protein with gpF-like domain
MPLAIDTLNIYSRLKATGLSEDSAKEIAEVFRETVEENLASKKDLKTTESNLTKDLKTTESNLTKYIESVRAELMKEIELVRKDIELIKAELKKDIESVRKEIAESKAGTIRWVAGLLVAQAGFIVALMKLL